MGFDDRDFAQRSRAAEAAFPLRESCASFVAGDGAPFGFDLRANDLARNRRRCALVHRGRALAEDDCGLNVALPRGLRVAGFRFHLNRRDKPPWPAWPNERDAIASTKPDGLAGDEFAETVEKDGLRLRARINVDSERDASGPPVRRCLRTMFDF